MTQIKPRIRFNQQKVTQMNQIMSQLALNTVCSEASCPNLGECYTNGTATFMILGKHCSRNCRFCDVTFGHMEAVDPLEPIHLAKASQQLELGHVVITSVARDDLADGGASQFAKTIAALKEQSPDTKIEVLIPDFLGNPDSLDQIIQAKPDIINHNIETVARLSKQVRHRATYERSLSVLHYIHTQAPNIYTKTGIMLGLGETKEEVEQAMTDALAVGVDFFTIGQYLQPSSRHYPLKEYVSADTFKDYYRLGMAKGFKFVASSPTVRSSYRAKEALTLGGHSI